MIGIILAAGKGTRLRPLTYAIPKPLLPVGGKPVIEYAIENLKKCGEIKKIYIAISHAGGVMNRYFRHVDYGIEIETIATNGWETGGDLKSVIQQKNITDSVVVAYGDIVTNISVEALLAFHRSNKKTATLSLFRVPWEDVHRFGIAEMDGIEVTRFVEKPGSKPATNLANAGYYLLEKKACDMLSIEKRKVEDTLFPFLAEKKELAGYVCDLQYWLDIGTIESYRKANRLMEGVLPPNNSEPAKRVSL